MQVERDPRKAVANREKHGLTFEEAARLLRGDEDDLELFDDSGHDEGRFIAIGPIDQGVIVVVDTERLDDILRIFSARRATRRETELFLEDEDAGHV